MALLQKRVCDLCGATPPDGEPMGTLFMPKYTTEDFNRVVSEELCQQDPMVMMTQGQQIAHGIMEKHKGQRWDVCKGCVDALTTWAYQRIAPWLAVQFHRLKEGS